MATEGNAERFDFAPVARRAVVAGFDGGAITSDAGAVLLGATDGVIGLVERFADCFIDRRKPELVEHSVRTLVGPPAARSFATLGNTGTGRVSRAGGPPEPQNPAP